MGNRIYSVFVEKSTIIYRFEIALPGWRFNRTLVCFIHNDYSLFRDVMCETYIYTHINIYKYISHITEYSCIENRDEVF